MPESLDDEIRRISELWENVPPLTDSLEWKYYMRDMHYLNWLKKEKEDRIRKNIETTDYRIKVPK